MKARQAKKLLTALLGGSCKVLSVPLGAALVLKEDQPARFTAEQIADFARTLGDMSGLDVVLLPHGVTLDAVQMPICSVPDPPRPAFLACAICEKQNIPADVNWSWFRDGKPVHVQCEASQSRKEKAAVS